MAARAMFSSTVCVSARSATAGSTRAARVGAGLSSRSTGFTPLMTAKLSTAPGMARLVNLVCEARSTDAAPNAMETAMNAIRDVEIPAVMRPALATAVANVLMASPANAGVLFDFNLTLPIIMGQFLVLMFILDKVVFTPVGEVLETRDAQLRDQLTSAKGNDTKLKELADEAKATIKAAMVQAKESESAAEKVVIAQVDEKMEAARAKAEKELAAAVVKLEAEKVDARVTMETQTDVLAQEIADKVLGGILDGAPSTEKEAKAMMERASTVAV